MATADERTTKRPPQRIEKPGGNPGWDNPPRAEGEVSLLALANVLLRWRRTVIGLSLGGAVLGLAIGLSSARRYVSSATFLPQTTDAGPSGLALAASQFGLKVQGSSGAWGPPIYVELLHSRALLAPLALDTVIVSEEGNRRVLVMDLLEVKGSNPVTRSDQAVRGLNGLVTATEVRNLNAVKLSVRTRWPSVSLALADGLLRGVNRFNSETRKSQAVAEREFVEARAAEAEVALRQSENRLQDFLQRNRVIGSPELAFERDRLQRDVTLRQQLYTSLLQNREEARIREVRDIPVITVIEAPELPVLSEGRRSVFKAFVGAVIGAVVGLLIAFLSHVMTVVRGESSSEAREFFMLLEGATPRFLRRKWR
jgi:uncharacterized protein involved in exopolysaccharide biosynthesis